MCFGYLQKGGERRLIREEVCGDQRVASFSLSSEGISSSSMEVIVECDSSSSMGAMWKEGREDKAEEEDDEEG